MRKIGILEVIISGICFGFLGFFGKKAYEMNILPGELLALRYSLAAGLVFIYLLLRRRKEYLLSTREAGTSVALGIFGYALFSSLFFYSLTGLSASLSVLLLYTYPIIVTVLSKFILKENLNPRKWLALILVTVGMYFLVAGEWKIEGLRYLLSGLGSAFFYSLYIIFSRKYLQKVSAFGSSLYVQLGAGLVLMAINFNHWHRPVEILSEHLLFVLTMAFICSFLAMSLFLAGLQKLTSTETSILSTTEPISGILIAHFFLGERMTALQWAASFLVILGLILVGFEKKPQPK